MSGEGVERVVIDIWCHEGHVFEVDVTEETGHSKDLDEELSWSGKCPECGALIEDWLF